MKRLAYSLGALGAVVAAAVAYFALRPTEPVTEKADGSFIVARHGADEPPLDPLDPAWARLAPAAVAIYPQVSVAPGSERSGKAILKVRALYNASTLALHLEWPDERPAKERIIGAFADAAAIQWPVRYGPGEELPYVGMGYAGAPVALWFWRADNSVETLAAEGFGTLTVQPGDGVKVKGAWKDGVWRAVFVRPLEAAPGDHQLRLNPASQGLVPISFAVWNGEGRERDGLKRLSAWRVLRFEKGKADRAYAEQLAERPVAGDAGNGRRLMEENGCIGCHAFPENSDRPSAGPDLTYAGAIHSIRYLVESIKEPSRTIVPGKGYATVEDGKRVSLMPPFAGTERELWDIVAYLKTLR
jgi:complex iron-sulfur molybdoenzyme family reductase subunit gamma